VLEKVTAVGARMIDVAWKPVVNASGYRVQYSPDPEFQMNVSTVRVGVSSNATTLRGLRENTIYNVRVQAMGSSGGGAGSGAFIDSMPSPEMTATTGIASGDETATQLQSLLAELQSTFQGFYDSLPQLETTVLTPVDRRRLNGSGVRRYGFIDKVSDVAVDYPQFWPASADMQEAMKERLREVEVLRNLLVWANFVSRVVQDLLMLAGDDAFRMANTYYGGVRAAAHGNLPEARQVFQMIEKFWQRPRRSGEEPTMPEVVRDVKALMRGSKTGSVRIENEGDQVVRGRKVVIDETQRKPRGGVKVVESEEVE
jgi:hypothetical protein